VQKEVHDVTLTETNLPAAAPGVIAVAAVREAWSW
jgi:hypothetical protein